MYFSSLLNKILEFLLEIKHDYKNVTLRGNWNEEPPQNNISRKTCPLCGYPLQLRYKNAYGLRLFLCTNEPEVCGFMTNEYSAGKLSVMKCDQCRDGYLIIKPRKEHGYMLGCTNYKKDGTGCGRIMTPKYFYEIMNIKDELPVPPKKFSPAMSTSPVSETNTSSQQPHTEVPVAPAIQKASVTPVMFEKYDLNEIIHTILQGLSHISETHYYGTTLLIDVLRGSESKRIIDAKLNLLPEYGKLKTVPREILFLIIEWMIENHYILKTKHPKYPVLHPTHEGTHYDETITTNKLKKLLNVLQNGDTV